MPLTFVIAVFIDPEGTPPANVPPAPLVGAVKVTVALATGFPCASETFAARATVKAVETVALCPEPATAVIVAAPPTVFVRVKVAGATTPGAEAVTVYAPAVAFAVNVGAVATPLAFVVAVFTPPAKVPPAPLAGAV